ncbi:MAG: ACP S-malonyltransferase [Cyclobacteriaceae bacterium]|nr:ACP S-malonyltransferase [Cyclobacteriaceae bacterium]
MTAFVFPGQGAQFTGMGKELYDTNPVAKSLFDQANTILGFDITEIMFTGSAEALKQTQVTQPAVFIHSVVVALVHDAKPNMVAGHSLGEFSALVANQTLSYEDGLKLVYKRAMAMQRACEKNPSTMAAILGLDDATVEAVCASITDEIVVAANYNCPGQLVISGSLKGIELACEKLKAAGAKRAMPLQVGGAFHSPLMEPAREELAAAIEATYFNKPLCPVYQNVNALPSTDVTVIKKNLIDQLTAPVRWTQSVQNMVTDGGNRFAECGPGKVLQGLVKKIAPQVEAVSL